MSYRIFLLIGLLFGGLVFSARADGPDFNALNQAFGVPLWSDDNLWDDGDLDVAKRLQWFPESRTTDDASFRRYAGADERVLGARPFSLALYGRGGKSSQISMVFANKGDSAKMKGLRADPEYKKQITADAKTIATALTAGHAPP